MPLKNVLEQRWVMCFLVQCAEIIYGRVCFDLAKEKAIIYMVKSSLYFFFSRCVCVEMRKSAANTLDDLFFSPYMI